MRSAAALLSAARSITGLENLIQTTGIAGESIELEADQMSALGIHGASIIHMAARGVGVRVIVAHLSSASPFRDWIQRTARTLTTNAPHVLWLVAVTAADGERAALA